MYNPREVKNPIEKRVRKPDFLYMNFHLPRFIIPYLKYNDSINCILHIYMLMLRKILRHHTGKCIRRFGGIYAYCRFFIDRKW